LAQLFALWQISAQRLETKRLLSAAKGLLRLNKSTSIPIGDSASIAVRNDRMAQCSSELIMVGMQYGEAVATMLRHIALICIVSLAFAWTQPGLIKQKPLYFFSWAG
jgi:hypothetical protein